MSETGAPLVGAAGAGLRDVLLRGASGAFAVRALGAGLAFGVQVLLARLLGVEHFGVFVYALTWVNLMAIGARLGAEGTMVRFVAAYRARDEWGLLRGLLVRFGAAVLAASLALAAAAAGVVWALDARLGGELTATFWAALLLLPPLGLIGVSQAVLRGLRRVVLAPLANEVLRPLAFAALLAAFVGAAGAAPAAHQAMLLSVAAGVAACAAALVWAARSLPRAWRTARPDHRSREWAGVGLSMALISVGRILLQRTDVVMIGALLGTTPAGIYAVAAQIALLVQFGIGAINAILAPMISELHATGRRDELQRVAGLAARAIALFSLAFVVAIGVAGDRLLALFGPEFTAGYEVLIVLALGQLGGAFAGSVGILLIMTGRHADNLVIIAAAVALNVGLNYLAITHFGVIGAAYTTAALLIARNAAAWIRARRGLGIDPSVFATLSRRPPRRPSTAANGPR